MTTQYDEKHKLHDPAFQVHFFAEWHARLPNIIKYTILDFTPIHENAAKCQQKVNYLNQQERDAEGADAGIYALVLLSGVNWE